MARNTNQFNKQLITLVLGTLLLGLSLTYSGQAASLRPSDTSSPRSNPHPSYYLGGLINIGQSDQDTDPYVAAAPDGSLDAVYTTLRWGSHPSQLAYTHSSDGGNTWSQAEQVSQGSGCANPGSASLTHAGGLTHILYNASSSNCGNAQLWYVSGSPSNWTAPQNIYPSPYNVAPFRIGATSSGLYAVIAGDYNYQPQMITSTNNGGSWNSPTSISTITGGGHGWDLAQSGDDLYFAYADIFGDGTRIRGRYMAASGWQPNEQYATGRLRGGYYPAVALDSANIYLAFCGWTQTNGDNHKDLYITQRTTDAPDTWLTPTQITQLPTGQDCQGTQLRYDPAAGQLLLLYQVTTVISGQLQDNLFLIQGWPGSFSAPTQLTSFSVGDTIQNPALLPTAAGWGVAFSYEHFLWGTPQPQIPTRAYYANLYSGSQPTPTAPAGGPTMTPAAASPTPTSALPTPQPTSAATRVGCQNPFLDLAGDPYQTEILWLYCRGIVSGRDASHFDPQGNATRSQFIKMLMQGFNINIPPLTPGSSVFNDVPPQHWAYNYVEGAYYSHLVNGLDPAWCDAQPFQFPCYGPDIPITRAQLARMVEGATGLPSYDPATADYGDVPIGSWAYADIETVTHYLVMGGYSYSYFMPNRAATRDTLSDTLYQALHVNP